MRRDTQIGIILGIVILVIIGVFLSTRPSDSEMVLPDLVLSEGTRQKTKVKEIDINSFFKESKKTELIKESIKGRKAVYFFVEQALEEENLNAFKGIIAKTVDNPLIAKGDLTWEEVFEQITNEDKLIIVFN